MKERNLIGANHVNDERLRHQRLDEPTGLKQRSTGWVPAVEDPQHHEERRVVEDRADGTNEENEPPDLVDLPWSRMGHLFVVNSVGGYWHLREVVEQIVGQHLNRRHRQEGKNALAPSTLNMFPKLELAPIRMYLRMFAKIFRPSVTPPSSTIRSFSSRIKSADSFAISVAVSTEIPTSAARRAGASLIPSPMNPTT